MADKISSLDAGYKTGELSIYPQAIDSTTTLYEVKNNAETILSQSLNYNAKFVVADNGSAFPGQGIIRVGTELIYYNQRSGNVFKDLKRGFAGTRQNQWPIGTTVGNAVAAEVHNAIKDAVINIEANLGLKSQPNAASLNGILSALETRFLAPKALFRAFPTSGPPPLKVQFQNFSGGPPIKFLWDFGDGTTSADVSPVHTYLSEGLYTVQLTMITSLGAHGISKKTGYIDINVDNSLPLFYVTPVVGVSMQSGTATTFTFVDQTNGNIVNRYWVWDDGTSPTLIDDPDVHTATHVYAVPGTYQPSLLLVFADGGTRIVTGDSLIVS